MTMATRYATWDWDTTESMAALVREPVPCDVCDGPGPTKCRACGLLLCATCADTDEHREYCESVQDGGSE